MHKSLRISALLEYLQLVLYQTVSDHLDSLVCSQRLLVLGLIQSFDYLLFFPNKFRWFRLDLSYLLFIFLLLMENIGLKNLFVFVEDVLFFHVSIDQLLRQFFNQFFSFQQRTFQLEQISLSFEQFLLKDVVEQFHFDVLVHWLLNYSRCLLIPMLTNFLKSQKVFFWKRWQLFLGQSILSQNFLRVALIIHLQLKITHIVLKNRQPLTQNFFFLK